MPTASVSLPPNLASRLNRVRGLIGVSQETLAKSAHVAQGTVSSLLSGKSQKPVRANYARKVVLAVQEAVEIHIKTTQASDDEATELRRPVSEALAFVEGRGEERSQMALPGGAIPPDAKNRVVRAEIEKYLQRGLDAHPRIMRIDGPPQSGKSTLLRLVERWATDLGMNVTYADRAIRDDNEPAHFAESLAREMASAWGVEILEKVDSVASLRRFIMRTRPVSSSERAIVVIDDLADMSRDLQVDVVKMCRSLQNESSRLNLSMLLAMEPLRRLAPSDPLISSREYFHFTLLKAFTEAQTQQFLHHYPSTPSESHGWMDGYLGGQPFLTHLALERLSAGSTEEEIEQESQDTRGPVGIHLQRLRVAIGDLFGASPADLQEPDRLFLEDMNILKHRSKADRMIWTSGLYATVFENARKDR